MSRSHVEMPGRQLELRVEQAWGGGGSRDFRGWGWRVGEASKGGREGGGTRRGGHLGRRTAG